MWTLQRGGWTPVSVGPPCRGAAESRGRERSWPSQLEEIKFSGMKTERSTWKGAPGSAPAHTSTPLLGSSPFGLFCPQRSPHTPSLGRPLAGREENS